MATALKSDAVFSATELGLSFGLQQILDGATVAVYPGEKVGLVGRNGCGKSSFLKIVAGVESADAGTVAYRQGAVVGYLPQDFELRDEASVVENVRDGVRELLEAIGRYESGEALSDGESERLLAKIEAEDGWNIGTRIESLMRELSAPGGERIVGTLSGGEKRRVALCRALVVRPDLLILDEPTNHLDAESVTWLEGALAGLTGACLFVTHDRYFLDRIATRIIELSAGRFFSHEGNYSDYLVAKAERQEREATVEKKRQGFLRREVEWVRAGVKARGTKQRSRIDNFYAVKSQKAPEKDLDMELVVPPAPPLGNVVVELEKAGVTRGEAGRLFSGMDLVFEPGQCTGVLGKNGVGKSTLLSVVLGELEPTEGTRRVGKKTIFNYVDQSRLQLDEEKSLLEEVSGDQEFVQFGEEQISVRGYLRRFLFSDDRINEPVKNLSGGEKARVLLAKILR
ncbi:MAG: ABC-F family ATP-binding cassette domain-containing protein, partial [Verrucomicrobiales bacterium]|nr:ABC-F family ATP-binding cassette domain-containing protein [Verrucomicrobiales bacterium]